MFRESLLDSSPQSRTRKRWPMAAAFTLEIIAAGVLVMIPLLTTGVIPVSAHVIMTAPLGSVHASQPNRPPTTGSRTNQPAYNVIPFTTGHHSVIRATSLDVDRSNTGDGPPDFSTIGDRNGVRNLPTIEGTRPTPVSTPKQPGHVIVSKISEGQLLVKVEPVYPHIALITHRNGVVQLHAVISKDGTIKSLSVASGEPMFVTAAIDAVKQWRYRPYYLNGEPVEVETFITVTFKGIRD